MNVSTDTVFFHFVNSTPLETLSFTSIRLKIMPSSKTGYRDLLNEC